MILFLHGSDTYRSRKKLKEIKEKFKKDVDPQGYNLTVFEGKDTKIDQLIDALQASPFLAPKRMVVLERYLQMDTNEELEKTLADKLEKILKEDTIFVLWEEGLQKGDFKKTVIKTASKSQYVMEFASWNRQQVAGWIQQQLSSENISIEPRALQHVSLSVDDDLWRASLEVNKLINYALAKNINRISNNEIRMLVSGGVQENIFALVDAISTGKDKEALTKLSDQIKSGSHPLEIMGMIIRQFRLLQQIKDGLDQGWAADQIAKRYGMHPFVVKKMSGQAQKISQKVIQKGYRRLLDVDKQIKSIGLDAGMLLNFAVIDICKNVKEKTQ